MTIDLLPLTEYTHDAPTAVTRLSLALRELEAVKHDIASFLFTHGVRGRSSSAALSPLAVFLHARVGGNVEFGGGIYSIEHDDFRFIAYAPAWLVDFDNDCVSGLHPLIEGDPCAGDVHPADIFATLVRS